MKHLKTYEHQKYGKRKVYWIIPFGNKFEDSLVQIYKQYSPFDDVIDTIDNALELSQDARRNLDDEALVLLTMEFEYDNNDKLVTPPMFEVISFSKKNYLDNNKYIYVGMVNITNEEIEIYTQAKKYNL